MGSAPDRDAAILHLIEAMKSLLEDLDTAARAEGARSSGAGWASMYSAAFDAEQHLDKALKAMGQERRR